MADGGMKMKAEVNFSVPKKAEECCRNCEFYDYGKCQLVAGKIDGSGKCDLFSHRDPPKSGGEELCSCDPHY